MCKLLFLRYFRTKPEDKTFKVNFGKGEEIRTWTQMNNLSQEEKDYIFKNAKQCTSFKGDISAWNIENVTKMTDIMSQEEIDAILKRK